MTCLSSTILILLSLLLLRHRTTTTAAALSRPTTALYVFGDSTVDPGNNNYLIPPPLIQANHVPYGESLPDRVPTGRFTDGRLVTDYIANWLGLKQFIPAYLDKSVSDRELVTGVSFASAGSGLDDFTVKITRALNMTAQVQYFEEALSRMERTIGKEKLNRRLRNALFLISVGTNDMVINYFDLATRALEFSPQEYSDFLIGRLRHIIQRVYKLGGRRFMVAGLPPMGCLPIQVTIQSLLNHTHWLQRRCVEHQNAVSRLYNDMLQALLIELQQSQSHPHATFSYADIYSPLSRIISHPSSYGFERALEGCCGTGTIEGGILCNALSEKCPNPSTYVFWDSIHPTQHAYRFIAKSLVSS